MLRYHFLIAVRHLRRAPVTTAINVFGLSAGIAACFLIALFVRDERSFDAHQQAEHRIVRVIETRTSDGVSRAQAVTPPALAPTLKSRFPQVEETARLYGFGRVDLVQGDTRVEAASMFLADSTVFKIFSFDFVAGNPGAALTTSGSAVISESVARRTFGDADPMGQEFHMDSGLSFTVTGVYRDLPRTSHIALDVVGSFQTLYRFETEERLSNWIWQQFYTYILLREPSDADAVEAGLERYTRENVDSITANWGFSHHFHLQPLSEIYLGSPGLFFDIGPRGSESVVWTLSGIGLFILLIACFNFMNLSTARSLTRAREVGLRKVVGAVRSQLVHQFLIESTLLALASLGCALLITWASAGTFSAFTGKPLLLDARTVSLFAGGGLMVMIIVGGLAGLYPALYLSGFKPIQSLKGSAGAGAPAVRRTLVIVQFAIGIGLLAGTAIIQGQLRFIQNRDPGFNRDLLVRISANGAVSRDPDAFIQKVDASSAVLGATHSWGAPGSFQAGDGVDIPGRDERWSINMYLTDTHFLDVYQMDLVAGRDFDPNQPTDLDQAFILNEAAVRELGKTPQEAIGQEMTWDKWSEDGIKDGRVVGVVRDFNYESVHRAIAPIVIHLGSSSVSHITVRLAAGRVDEGLDAVKTAWASMVPETPISWTFVDDDLADDYQAEQRIGRLTALFAMLAVLIACLGLFALASFVVERRLREIGIRKVLGASATSIGILMTREFVILVAVAFVLGAPLAMLVMKRWLEGFAYRFEPGPVLYLGVGVVALFVAILTVGTQAWRAARLDPVRNLRSE